MNCLLYSINEINNQIPSQLLYEAFTIDEEPNTINLTSLDDKILRKLLKKRVLLDTNIIGGVEMLIPLVNISPTYYENYYTIYQIPPEETMNREIISALSIVTMPLSGIFNQVGGYIGNTTTQNSSVLNVADRIGQSVAPSMILSNTHLEIVGHNTILVNANYRLLGNVGLRVLVENDSNLNNIQPRSYKAFSFMCVLAAKAYIYNKLIIPVNSGYLASGQDLGMFKNILESYSSAEEDYRNFISERMGSVLFMNDTTRYSRFLTGMMLPSV